MVTKPITINLLWSGINKRRNLELDQEIGRAHHPPSINPTARKIARVKMGRERLNYFSPIFQNMGPMLEVGTRINRIIKMSVPQPRKTATNLKASFILRFNVKISDKNTKVLLGRGLNISSSRRKEIPYKVNLGSVEAVVMKINNSQNPIPVENGGSNAPPRDKNRIFKIGHPRKHRTYGNQDSTSTWQLPPVTRSRGRNTKSPTREPPLKSMENFTL